MNTRREPPITSYKPITNVGWVRALLCKLQKGCTRLAAASDKAYQLLARDRWFSPGIHALSTTNTGRHDKKFINPDFPYFGTTFLGIWSRGGKVLLTKCKQTLTL
jgi:hypothetical protein